MLDAGIKFDPRNNIPTIVSFNIVGLGHLLVFDAYKVSPELMKVGQQTIGSCSQEHSKM